MFYKRFIYKKKGGINLSLSKLKIQYFLKLKHILHYPLGKFVGTFYWKSVGQGLLLVKLWDRNSCQYGDRREKKLSLGQGEGSEERMVCTGSGCRDFKKYHMFDAFVFL